MKAIANPYEYDLNEFRTILINEEGKIIGGFMSWNALAKGEKIRLPIKGTGALEVVETKLLVIVKE